MKKTFILLFIIGLTTISCKREFILNKDSSASIETKEDKQRTIFAEQLAKALANPEVREIIKSEALKKFDNDYEMLYEKVKDLKGKSGYSFAQIISNQENAADIDQISDNLPLLTIMVPKFSNFSAETWNTDSEIPLVAVVNSEHIEKNTEEIVAFDHLGNKIKLNTNQTPHVAVIVVKENERILSEFQLKERSLKASSHNFVFSKSGVEYYFWDKSFINNVEDSLKLSKLGRRDIWFDQKLRDAYDLAVPSQRDYVYYDISTSGGSGPLDYNYAEYLWGFGINSTNSMNYLNDDPTSDWSDGAMEFQMDVLFFNGTSSLTKVSKVFSIRPDQFETIVDYNNPDGERKWYTFPAPIMIATWDMQQMGDTWKYVVNEIDPGTVTTNSHTLSSKFASNFKVDLSLDKIVKLGIGFGSSIEASYTTTTTIQVTTGSDFCGEAISSFLNPVLVGKIKVPMSNNYVYKIEELNTGTVSIEMQPRRIGG